MSACVVAGCGGASSGGVTGAVAATPVLTTVRVSLTPDTLVVGQSMTASAAGLDQKSAVIGIGALSWSTSSPSVAIVSQNGVISAVAPGRTMVIASANGTQGERLLTVVQASISRVSITPEAARVVRGATVHLTATALDYNGRPLSDRRIDWTTSDASKATVTSTGAVTALSPGVVTIIATGEGVNASVVVTITAAVDVVASMSLSPSTGTLTVGGSLQLVATLKDAAGATLAARLVTWSVSGVSGANVATVSNTGLVAALSPGTAIVEAFSEGQHGAAAIIVGDNVDTTIVVTFAAPVANELVGDTLRVAVGVKSPYPLASVVAAVGPARKLLTLSYQRVGALGGSYLWLGSVDVTDIASGPFLVEVTATDNRTARGVASRQVLRDVTKGKGGTVTPPRQK